MSVIKHIEKLEKLYDKYAKFYNSQDSKIAAFSELSNVFTGIDRFKTRKSDSLKYFLDRLKDSFLGEAVGEGRGVSDSDIEVIDNYFKKLQDGFYLIIGNDHLSMEIIETLNKVGEFKENSPYFEDFETVLGLLSDLQIVESHCRAFIHLQYKIIIDEYPPEIEYFSDLSENEKQSISVGSSYSVGNPDFVNNMYDMPDGFYGRAKELSINDWNQESIYKELLQEFQDYWTDKKPSFITVYRRLKEKKIW